MTVILGLNVSEISLTSGRFIRLQVPPKRWYRYVGTGVLVPVWWYRYVGTGVLVLVCWYRCDGTGVLVPVCWYWCARLCGRHSYLLACKRETRRSRTGRTTEFRNRHARARVHTHRRVLFKPKCILVPQSRVECIAVKCPVIVTACEGLRRGWRQFCFGGSGVCRWCACCSGLHATGTTRQPWLLWTRRVLLPLAILRAGGTATCIAPATLGRGLRLEFTSGTRCVCVCVCVCVFSKLSQQNAQNARA